MPLAAVEQKDFDNARDFLEYLRPSNLEVWGKGLTNTWIYRGQWNADWPLAPSAFRPSAKVTLKPILDTLRPYRELPWEHLRPFHSDPGYRLDDIGRNKEKYKDRILDHILWLAAEQEVVHQFTELADELGFHTLATGELVQSGEKFLKSFNAMSFWPCHLALSPVYAFAQHHGVPTRMLDWTRNPLFAAFFAVSTQSRSEPPPERIAVWAYDRAAYGRQTDSNVPPFMGDTPKVIEMTCPRHQHSFLHAQAGLFQLAAQADSYWLYDEKWPTFDSIAEIHYIKDTAKPLRKITLPVEEADELLFLLHRERVTRANLMPTYDNIVHTLKDEWSLHTARP